MNKHTENYHLLHYVAPQSGLQTWLKKIDLAKGNLFTLAKLAKVIFALEGSQSLVRSPRHSVSAISEVVTKKSTLCTLLIMYTEYSFL